MSHVALVIPGLERVGGAERQVMLLAVGLRSRGWRVSVVALTRTGKESAEALSAAGVETVNLEMHKGLADPRGWFRFNLWLHRERPDVIHAHLPHAAWMARWSRLCSPLRRLMHPQVSESEPRLPFSPSPSLPSPVIIDTLHSSSCGPALRRMAYRSSDWLADCVTAVSKAVAEAHLAAGMVARTKLSVVPNGVDVEDFRPDSAVRAAMRHKLGLAKEFLWFAAGRLDPVKDYPTLLKAFAQLPESARLVIAGEGPLRTELCSLTAQLRLEHRIRFLGFEPDVKPWLCAADGFVLSSKWEGLPVSLLEAGACALPAVATDVPGSREVIVHGRTGLLTPPGATSALARTMGILMRFPAGERTSMGRLARLHVSERFSLGSVLDRWWHTYSELLHRRRRVEEPMAELLTT